MTLIIDYRGYIEWTCGLTRREMAARLRDLRSSGATFIERTDDGYSARL